MEVEIKFIVETADFGESEFKKEIEKLIEEIDNSTKLLSFEMKRVE